ncbi:MAG: RHS repeat-associated core domain-containing protein, partial [Terriglobia bacterium]
YPWGQVWTTSGSGVNPAYARFPDWDPYADVFIGDHRKYNWNHGRWLSPDPMGGNVADPQSLNRYSYALNNPTTLTDPSGLDPLDDCDMNTSICAGGSIGDPCTDPTFADSNAECGTPGGTGSCFFDPDCGPFGLGGLFSTGGGGGGSAAGTGSTASSAITTPLTGPEIGGPPGFESTAQVIAQIGVYASPWEIDVLSICALSPGCQDALAGAVAGVIVYKGVQEGIKIYQAKGGKQNIVPSWAAGARPFPGESASEFANRLCKQQYPPDGAGCGNGPGSERNKIRKWAHDKFGI